MKIKIRIITAISGLLLLGLLAFLFIRQPAPDPPGYIFDRTSGPAIEQIEESKEQVAAIKEFERSAAQSSQTNDSADQASTDRPPEEQSVIKDLFSQVMISSGTTLRYFTFLGHENRHAASREEHLDQVRQSIFSRFPPDEAQALFETYQQYLECEIAVAEMMKDFGPVNSVEDSLALLREAQEFRRDFLGADLADNLFGERVKKNEYAVRRAAIISDNTIYAAEKQEQLDRLSQDMWGESADPDTAFEPTDGYSRYRESLDLHQKDLNEITTEADRQAYIDDIRNQHLPPETVERIKALEQQQTEQQQQEQTYFAEKQKITEDPNLSEEARSEQIDQLRHEMLGDQAAAMKRREAIENARQKRIRELESTSDPGP